MSVQIPKANIADTVSPSWIPTETSDGKPSKPIIRCQCGSLQGIGLHHVHADGRVTASFFHAAAHELQKDAQGYFFMHKGKRYSTEPGCGWHVFLQLKDYDRGEFPPQE
jgi:hypothetical protein